MIDYNIQLMSDVIAYNKKRYNAFKTGEEFIKNIDFEKILNARYQKISRIKKRLLYLIVRHKYIWFCTFTFSNKYINKCERTKRDLIKSVLNNNDFKYILNIDYGKNTQRQHFHCILATNENIDINKLFQDTYIGGFSCSILCKNGLEDFKRLSKYINKLVNHCLKATTNRQRLLYNFKGYDVISSNTHDVTLMYKIEYDELFNNGFYNYKDVSLLDKADITGKTEV